MNLLLSVKFGVFLTSLNFGCVQFWKLFPIKQRHKHPFDGLIGSCETTACVVGVCVYQVPPQALKWCVFIESVSLGGPKAGYMSPF